MMTSKEFIEKAIEITKLKTIYAMGMFGWPVNDYSINRKLASSQKSWYTTHASKYNKVKNQGYFGFDCVNLIKAIVWGFNANLSTKYGGCTYESNNLPDVSDATIWNYCHDVSTDMKNIQPGEILGMKGHVGIYVGNNNVVECTTGKYWKVAVTDLNYQKWTKHGKLNVIDYTVEEPARNTYIVVKGDTLSKIGKKLNIAWKDIAALNNIKWPHIIRVGQVLQLPGAEVKVEEPTITTYTVQKGDTLWGIAKKQLGSGTRYTEIMKLNGMTSTAIYKGKILLLPKK